MREDRQFFKPAEIAPQLGVTTGRLYQLIRAGRIPVIREGRAIRIPRGAWNAWLRVRNRRALAAVR
jgi:excisionase family DNA binding protein